MADRDVDELEADLSKKQRLINAWIAVGPEGKTTDVSDLTDSSRGYASDLRRGLEGDEEEQIEMDEIRDAYHPELVAKYRSELGDDAVDGEWDFTDRLRRQPPERPPSEPERRPVDRTQPPNEAETRTAGGPERTPQGRPRQPSQPQSGAGGRPSRPPSGPTGRPPDTPPTGPGQQPGGQAAETGQFPQAAYTGQPPQTGQQPATGGAPMQRQAQQAQHLLSQLQDLDNSLTYQQQQAQTEINSVPPQSIAQSIAISKYNLIVEIRQSIQQMTSAAGSP